MLLLSSLLSANYTDRNSNGHPGTKIKVCLINIQIQICNIPQKIRRKKMDTRPLECVIKVCLAECEVVAERPLHRQAIYSTLPWPDSVSRSPTAAAFILTCFSPPTSNGANNDLQSFPEVTKHQQTTSQLNLRHIGHSVLVFLTAPQLAWPLGQHVLSALLCKVISRRDHSGCLCTACMDYP